MATARRVLYGYGHRRTRARWEAKVQRGEVDCARCGRPIEPGSPWDLDHSDTDKRVYLGPSHRSCNTRAGQRSAMRVIRARKHLPAPQAGSRSSRAW